MQFASFVAELRRRRVFRVVAAYAVAAWAIMQVADLVLPRLGLPDWTVTLVVVLTLLGLPIALILGWIYDLTPAGVQRTPSDPAAALAPLSRRAAAWYLGLGILITLVGMGAYARVHARAAAAEDGPLRSLAVLPFVDMSPGHDQEYFSDGLTDELLNSLARLEGVRLAARTSAFQFKGRQVDLREVGKSLGVSGVIEGSVQRLGDRIRITIQLIDARAGFHVWSQKYDRDARDLFAVQDEISEAVAQALQVELAGEQARRRPTTSLQAHDLYLKGRFFWNQRTPQSLQQAVEHFQQALALDPEYALAYSGLAEAYVTPSMPLPPARAIPLARDAAQKALAREPRLVAAHIALATALLSEFDLAGAERAYRRALELDPEYPTAHQWYAELVALRGSLPAALAETRRAQQLDPLSMIIGWQVGYMLLFLRRDQEALTEFQNLAQLYPAARRVQYALAETLLRLQRYDEAIATIAALFALTPAQAQAARRTVDAGGPGALAQALWNPRRLPIPDSTDDAYAAYASERLVLCAQSGRVDEAIALLQWLQRTRNLDPWQVIKVQYDPAFERVRRDQRISRMLRELGVAVPQAG